MYGSQLRLAQHVPYCGTVLHALPRLLSASHPPIHTMERGRQAGRSSPRRGGGWGLRREGTNQQLRTQEATLHSASASRVELFQSRVEASVDLVLCHCNSCTRSLSSHPAVSNRPSPLPPMSRLPFPVQITLFQQFKTTPPPLPRSLGHSVIQLHRQRRRQQLTFARLGFAILRSRLPKERTRHWLAGNFHPGSPEIA